MKRNIVCIFILAALIFISECNHSASVETEKSVTENKIAAVNASPVSSPEQTANVSESDSKLPRVWVGSISLDNGIINSSNSVWSGGDDTPPDIPESQGGIKVGTMYGVDIMNCGGYLGSGKIAFIERGNFSPDWRLVITPETIAADGAAKIKQCDASPQNEFAGSDAFAVTPQNKNRQKIKIGKIDTRKLFASLPKETQKSLKNKYGSDIHKKGDLSVSEEDNWTDINGDGRMDLVYVFSMYDVEHGGGGIMMLVNGKWKDIGSFGD